MSQDQIGKTTRRAFLGTATVATAASLAAPVASEAQGVGANPAEPIKLAQANADVPAQLTARAKAGDWTKPAAMAIPKEGYFQLEQGRYGPIYPKTPANYGFTVIAKIKSGREAVIRAYGKTIESAVAGDPSVLAALRLHYLRWVLFNIGGDTYFMYQGIFDTDFDKYTEDAINIFTQTGLNTVFRKQRRALFQIGRRTLQHSSKFVREHRTEAFSNMVSIHSSPPTRSSRSRDTSLAGIAGSKIRTAIRRNAFMGAAISKAQANIKESAGGSAPIPRWRLQQR